MVLFPRRLSASGIPVMNSGFFEWMRRVCPLVDVLTDGSGPDRPSRFQATKELLQSAGARLGEFQGNYPDRDFYNFILQKSPDPFLKMAECLTQKWIEQRIETVAGDMSEGFSPTHDICRILINAVVLRIERTTGCRLLNLEFPLERMMLPADSKNMVVVQMDDEQFTLKRMAATKAYPALASEVERLIAKHGEALFKVETLAPADRLAGLTWDAPEPPFYETYGRQQIALGHYRDLITHADYIRPLAVALYSWADG